MSFETPSRPVSTHSSGEGQPEKGKLQFTKAEVVIAAIVAGTAASVSTVTAVERYRINNPEYIRADVLDLGEEMNKLFGTKLQVESRNGQYIIHIAQLHAGVGDTADQRAEVVRYQKDVEKLIRELKQRYGINVFFHEGRTVEGEEFHAQSKDQNTVKSALVQYQEDGHSFYFKYKLLPSLEEFGTRIRTFDVDQRNTPEARRYDAEVYFALKKDEQLLLRLSDSSETPKSQEKKQECETALRHIKELLRLAEANDGFMDQIWLVMGATEKLAREEVIISKPAETEEARANKPNALFQTFGTAREFHERREDVASGFGADYGYKANSTYIPIVYGASHDFSDAVKRLNTKKDLNSQIGLMRIDYRPQSK